MLRCSPHSGRCHERRKYPPKCTGSVRFHIFEKRCLNHVFMILFFYNSSSIELFSALNALKYDPNLRPHILDIRGRGLMVGLEFASPSSPGVEYDQAVLPASSIGKQTVSHPENLASRVAKRCIEKGMLLLTTSTYEVVRFIPPLNISKEDLAKGCAIFGEAVREVVKEG